MQTISRRGLLAAGAATALAVVRPPRPARAGAPRDHRLVAGAARVSLVGAGYPGTDVWAYGGTVPGPSPI